MAFPMTYPKGLTLDQLKGRMRNDEGLAGSETKLGHDDDNTLVDFDEGPVPDGDLLLDELKPDDDEKRDGHTFICKGKVWVKDEAGQIELKDVGAFRAD